MTFPSDLVQTGADLLRTTTAYNKAWASYAALLPPLDEATFWDVARRFTELVLARAEYKKGDPVERGADELFRLEAVGMSSHPFGVLVQFAKAWGVMSDRLGAALEDVVEGYSDDSFGDLTDSLPFAGQAFCVKCLVGGFKSDVDFQAAVAAASEPLRRLLAGENYVETTLYTEARRRGLHKIRETPPPAVSADPRVTDERDDF